VYQKDTAITGGVTPLVVEVADVQHE
jgi:hypothetical protein